MHSSSSQLQVRKSVRLKLLSRIEAFVDSPGQQEYFELTFLQVRGQAWRAKFVGAAQLAAVCAGCHPTLPMRVRSSCCVARASWGPCLPPLDLAGVGTQPMRLMHDGCSVVSPLVRRGWPSRCETRLCGWSCWARSTPSAGERGRPALSRG